MFLSTLFRQAIAAAEDARPMFMSIAKSKSSSSGINPLDGTQARYDGSVYVDIYN
jgi:hypothetical protein